jgi:hypothetical protein
MMRLLNIASAAFLVCLFGFLAIEGAIPFCWRLAGRMISAAWAV